MNLLWK